MSKLFAAFVILGTVFVLALPAPASADPRPDGVRNLDQYEFSSHRRYYRRYRYYRPYRYVRPYPYWGPYPYYGYYRPYYRPYYYRPYVGFGFWW